MKSRWIILSEDSINSIEQLKTKLQEIKKLGFICTHRRHDTGVGKTLEDLLEIKENNLQLPDFSEIENKIL